MRSSSRSTAWAPISSRYVGGGQRGPEVLRPVPGHDAGDRQAPRHGDVRPLEGALDAGQGRLVDRGDRGDAGMLVEQPLQAGLAGRGVVAAAQVDAGQPAPVGDLGEPGERALGRPVPGGDQLGGPVDQGDVAVAEVGEVVDALGDQGGVVEVHPGGAPRVGGVPDRDERQAGLPEPVDPLVLQPDLHQDDAVDPAAADDPFEGPVVVAAGGREQHVEVRAGGGLDHAGDEPELHVGQPQAGRRDDQAEGAGPALLQRPGRGVGPVVQLVDDRLDPPLGRRGDRPLAAERVRDGAAGHPGPAGDLADVHRVPQAYLVDESIRPDVRR